MDARHFGSEFWVIVLNIGREDVGFGIKMIKLLELPAAALFRVAQSGHKKPIWIESIGHRGGGVHNVLTMLVLNVVSKLPARDAFLFSLLSTIRAEEGLPVVGDAEDDVCIAEGLLESCDVVEISGHDLGTGCGKLLGPRGRRIAGQAADPETGLEEAPGYGTALIPRSADNTNELLAGHGELLEAMAEVVVAK